MDADGICKRLPATYRTHTATACKFWTWTLFGWLRWRGLAAWWLGLCRCDRLAWVEQFSGLGSAVGHYRRCRAARWVSCAPHGLRAAWKPREGRETAVALAPRSGVFKIYPKKRGYCERYCAAMFTGYQMYESEKPSRRHEVGILSERSERRSRPTPLARQEAAKVYTRRMV